MGLLVRLVEPVESIVDSRVWSELYKLMTLVHSVHAVRCILNVRFAGQLTERNRFLSQRWFSARLLWSNKHSNMLQEGLSRIYENLGHNCGRSSTCTLVTLLCSWARRLQQYLCLWEHLKEVKIKHENSEDGYWSTSSGFVHRRGWDLMNNWKTKPIFILFKLLMSLEHGS